MIPGYFIQNFGQMRTKIIVGLFCSWPTYSSVAGPPTHHRDVWKHRSKAEGKGWRLEGG
jgi:hypothetical protein